ncbi:MAG: hypothetical protein ABEK59_09040 [Halobacteria archaeon]
MATSQNQAKVGVKNRGHEENKLVAGFKNFVHSYMENSKKFSGINR